MSARTPTLLSALVAAVCLSVATEARAEKLSAAVFNLQSQFGVPEGVATLLSENLAVTVRAAGAFSRVYSARDVEDVLAVERQRQLFDCDSAGCAAEIAGAMGVDVIITGTVGKLGGSWLVNLKMFDGRNGALLAALSERITGATEEALLDAIRPSVVKLLDAARIPHTLAPSLPPPRQDSRRPLWRIIAGAVLLGGAGLGVLVGLAALIAAVGSAVTFATMYLSIFNAIEPDSRAVVLRAIPLTSAAFGILVLAVAAAGAAAGAAATAAYFVPEKP